MIGEVIDDVSHTLDLVSIWNWTILRTALNYVLIDPASPQTHSDKHIFFYPLGGPNSV